MATLKTAGLNRENRLSGDRGPGSALPGRVTPVPRSRRISPWTVRPISIIFALGLWELVGRQVNPLFLVPPSSIIQAFIDTAQSGELWEAFFSTLRALAAGFVAGSVIGVVLGLVIGRYRLVEYSLDVYIYALYATPMVALIPLIMLWVGLGLNAKITVVMIMVLFPVLINVHAGVKDVSGGLLQVSRAFKASEWQTFTKIILPATVPYLMSGLQQGIGRGVVGVVVAEFFTALSGLGGMLVSYANAFRTAYMFVPVIILMLMGVILSQLVAYCEKRIAPWKETERTRQ